MYLPSLVVLLSSFCDFRKVSRTSVEEGNVGVSRSSRLTKALYPDPMGGA